MSKNRTNITENNKTGNSINKNHIRNSNHFEEDIVSAKDIGTDFSHKFEILWHVVISFTILHLIGLWGVAVIVNGGVSLKTLIWTLYWVYLVAGQGVTIGAHRYYTHRSFKATPLLRAFFVVSHTVAGTFSLFHWCLVHRQHHRYSDTDADPHNSKRGFFFSHMGWSMVKRHPYVKKLERRIDMSDLKADWMVMFQKKYYIYLFFVFAVLLPVWVPVRYFGESVLNSFLVCFIVRYVMVIHMSSSINSVAHLYGTRPYDKRLQPVESWFASVVTLGEGWHNFHHAFPWDYKAAEFFQLNLSARFIQLYEKFGLAYDLKTVSPEQVKSRILQSGDGTHHIMNNDEARACMCDNYNGTLHTPNSLNDSKVC